MTKEGQLNKQMRRVQHRRQEWHLRARAKNQLKRRKYALDLKERLKGKYPDLDAGVANHVLFMVSNSFKDEVVQ